MEQRIRMLQQTIEQALLEQVASPKKLTKTLNDTFRFTVESNREDKISLRCSQAGQSPERYFIPQECGAPRLVSMLGPSRSLKTATTHSP